MKPIPAQSSLLIKSSDSSMPSLPTVLSGPSAPYSKANRRAGSSCTLHRAYPWLLFVSTGIAATFCLMYISKPIIYAAQEEKSSYLDSPKRSLPAVDGVKSSIMPDQNSLPGDAEKISVTTNQAREALSQSQSTTSFEQTNMRIQHILTAETPSGDLARIDIDVPVLYQSRSLRWTPLEVAEARGLLARLADYQEKSSSLRAEGAALLASWNHLIDQSIPSSELRADSPTLPANQEDSADTPHSVGLDTAESIQIKATGK